MDYVLAEADRLVLTPFVYPASVPEDTPWRQFLSLWAIAMAGGASLYFTLSTLSYVFLFDKKLRQHHLFVENQAGHTSLSLSHTHTHTPYPPCAPRPAFRL
jgi:hypothetical protein